MRFKFIHNETNEDIHITRLEYNTDNCCLPHLLEDFEFFLKGCGFNFKGKIVIVDEDLDEL
jgi:hypothetical protein